MTMIRVKGQEWRGHTAMVATGNLEGVIRGGSVIPLPLTKACQSLTPV
jgi:hypothetical protein